MGTIEEGCAMATYEITVVSGTERGPGTNANVYLTLHGDKGSSGEIALDNDADNFEAGSVDSFVVDAPDIGKIERITIRHDDKGFASGWFLEQVAIRDQETGEELTFPCGQWLARREGDGKIERELTPLPAPTFPALPAAPLTSAELATAVLANGSITLATVHSSTNVDTATAHDNISDTSAGNPASRSDYDNAPGGTVALAPVLLQSLLDLAGTYTYSISELAGGSHTINSRHYSGVAVDVNVINGQHVGAKHPDYEAFMQQCRDLGATEVLGPGDPGHNTHVHCAWPRP
jgi:hypothetical protein